MIAYRQQCQSWDGPPHGHLNLTETEVFEETEDRPLTRYEKRLVRYKGCLVCEACGRYTEVSPGKKWGEVPTFKAKKVRKQDDNSWEGIATSGEPFFCSRDKCVNGMQQLFFF